MNKQAANARRSIPDDFAYNPKKLKHLKRILHNVSVSLGTLSSAVNEFSRLKGPEISPDGMLGGVGYIIPIAEIKKSMISAVHELSGISDCIADELNNPGWEAEDDTEVKKLIKEKDDVSEKVEEEVPEISPDDVVNPEKDDEDQDDGKDKDNGGKDEDEIEVSDVDKDKDEERFRESNIRDVLGSAIRRKLANEN